MSAMPVHALNAVPSPRPLPVFRGRIGCDARSGHYAVPGRYRLHLSLSCPGALRIAVVHSLLGLADVCPVTLLPAVPDGPDGEHSALRPLYEASAHRYPGAAVAPVLSDDWSGRIVSTHAPDIMRDLARRFGGGRAVLYPEGAETEIEGVARLCAQGVDGAAQRAGRADADEAERRDALGSLLRTLRTLDARLARQEYVLGGELTVADVELWVALVRLDTVHRWHLDAGAVHRVADHPHLWAYARRLTAHPAFGPHLDLTGIALRHHAHCRGLEAAGAAVQILDWASHVPDQGVSTDGQASHVLD
ncbi:glutathione S-transferase C-terminal domain-containing protein [Streptomyces scabiei]|uniref:glutathione S-transferase C-terminal domain-containing protein n=1 Tax=Streptomyces scabiei TaxID=1930 RepID=UPI001B30AEF5|nr:MULTISPECIES: glutathione S-transferase C-terminal domain-containing protein [Streptomyces]MBP5859958.1 glutathione S-transferase family protein [Streptomyces sp. LBUM 1484]MBP5879757.1 glutathione S-transferase family protein [Streptomyces sp. LBUM 1477]MBP5887586.1 glutathione S-transferase family protein [Streptomyces sp. LBUM 1487]MBP5903588.1 glutathione S-transferase family protein [Streptomyces sp. LBUM 1488]MDW8477231.1 glutathione S-transferase C-terminal domain-containing protein 